MKNSRQKKTQKDGIKDIDEKQRDEEKCPKTKSIIEFAVKFSRKKNDVIKPTTRFFSGKMLIFAKISFENFTYYLTKTFFFPNKITREIYEKYLIERIYLYSVLTDTDSICVFFIFICKPKRDLPDRQFRDVLFEVIKTNKILERFFRFRVMIA